MPACQLREFLYIFDTVLRDTFSRSFVHGACIRRFQIDGEIVMAVG